MGKVILTPNPGQIEGFHERLELYDEQGDLLGYCTPAEPGLKSLPRHAGSDPFRMPRSRKR